MKTRDWYLFSSSSGESLGVLWGSLGPEEKMACKGIFCDRKCGSYDRALTLNFAPDVKVFERPHFEKGVLDTLTQSKSPQSTEPLVLLCGFFGILSADFLKAFPGPIVNTHPSLLPAFPGMDKKVHALAEEQVAISGFTMHLVSEELDGGTILFQQPVWVDPTQEPGSLREQVRQVEQFLMPKIWKQLLYSQLTKKDLSMSSFQLRRKLGLTKPFFHNHFLQEKEN